MVYCTRCLLRHAMKMVIMVVIVIGMGMIIYSLWLLKAWKDAVPDLQPHTLLPRPWFVYAFLGVGIVVCISMLFGQIVANRISMTSLSVFIVSIFTIILLQIIAIVDILFKMKWDYEYIDIEFRKFFLFHLTVCRLIGITVLFGQANVFILAVVLWALRPEPRNHCVGSITSNLSYSFLSGLDSRVNSSPSVPFARTFEV